jgi:hypothetical protein
MTTHLQTTLSLKHSPDWITAVKRVRTLAQRRLPDDLHGRIRRATALVLTGGVWLDEDGHTCQVRSSEADGPWYSANGACPCPDYPTAPEHLCTHRPARGIYLRTGELLREGLPTPTDALDGPATVYCAACAATFHAPHHGPHALAPLPEAPASVNYHVTLAGRQVLVTLRDTDKTRLLDRLTTRLARFLVPATPTPAGASTSLSVAQPTPEGWCGVHGVQMQLHHGKDGRTWYSHKTADRWCKGR